MGTKSNISRLLTPVVSTIFASIGFLSFVFAQVPARVNGLASMNGIDTGIHPDSPTRTKIDLNGEWTCSLDGETWRPIGVPSAIDMEGRIEFRRRFTVTDSLLSNSAFKFVALGINYEAEIFVNEVFVGRHVGGYTSFEYDIPDEALQLGPENTIRIVVQNELTGRTTVPLRQQVWGWKNDLGILRDVFLVAVPRMWIDRLTAHTDADEASGQASAVVRTVLTFKGHRLAQLDTSLTGLQTQPASFVLELVDRYSGALVAPVVTTPAVIEANKNTGLEMTLPVSAPKFWSPETPELYVLRASLVLGEGKTRRLLDQTLLNIGFRSVRLSGPDIYVNGRRTLIKGVVWHEDAPATGAALTYEQMEKDIVMMKSLGVNTVRFAFHPPHPYLLNLCSRYGLFAIEEIPVWNVPAEVLADESFTALAEAQAREMVERDQAAPAVLAWGIGHAFDSSDDRAAVFVRRIREAMRALDPRPVYAGVVLLAEDRSAAETDLAAVIVPTDDLKLFKHQLTDWKITHPRKPVWVLAYGRPVLHQNRNGYSDPLSQEAQARFFLQYYGAMKEAGVAGSFVDAFADWRGDRPLMTVPVEDRSLYPMGLVSAAREKRLSFEMVRVLYNEEKISALPAGSSRTAFPLAHVLTGLSVIILVGYQYSYNRRFGEALKRSLMRSYNFFADLRDLHTVSSLHTAMLAGCISVTFAVILSAILYHYRTDRIFDYVLTFFVASNSVKERLIWATWNPFVGIVVFTGLFFLIGVLLALLLKLAGFLFRARTRGFHVYSVSVWGAAPVIFLSPVAMSLFKIMETPLYVLPSLVLILIFLGWTLLRVLKGISVVFDTSPVRTTIGGIILVLLVCGGFVLYYDATYALGSYVTFVVHLVQTLG